MFPSFPARINEAIVGVLSLAQQEAARVEFDHAAQERNKLRDFRKSWRGHGRLRIHDALVDIGKRQGNNDDVWNVAYLCDKQQLTERALLRSDFRDVLHALALIATPTEEWWAFYTKHGKSAAYWPTMARDAIWELETAARYKTAVDKVHREFKHLAAFTMQAVLQKHLAITVAGALTAADVFRKKLTEPNK